MMKMRHLASACVFGIAMGATAAYAEFDTRQLEVIVGNHTDSFTREHQLPFYTETLSQVSGGKITARAIPYTELGLTGFEIMNLLKLGTNDISWGVIGYLSGESPVTEGLDLPGLANDVDAAYQMVDAYTPIIAREMEEKFNAKLLTVTLYPPLQAFCKLPEDELANFSLETLRGKNIRVHAKSFADLVESFGGIPVTMGFGDVVPALERGVIDCAITSSYVAYGFNMGQVANTIVDLPAFANFFTAMNLDTWNSLNAETQALLSEEFGKHAADLRSETVKSAEVGANCLREGPCPRGEPSGMIHVEMSADDLARLNKGIQDVVLTRWIKRCGADCAVEWNGTIGKLLGVSLAEN